MAHGYKQHKVFFPDRWERENSLKMDASCSYLMLDLHQAEFIKGSLPHLWTKKCHRDLSPIKIQSVSYDHLIVLDGFC